MNKEERISLRIEKELKEWLDERPGGLSKFIRKCILAGYKATEGKAFIPPEEDLTF